MGTLSTISAAAPATAAQAVSELHARLADVGAHRIYVGALGPVAVLSLRGGLTVWCWGGLFRWRENGGAESTHSAADPAGAAHRLVPAETPQPSPAAEQRQAPPAADDGQAPLGAVRPYAAGVAA